MVARVPKTRPCVIVSRTEANDVSSTVPVVPLSSVKGRAADRLVQPFLSTKETHLPKDSRALCDQVRTIDKRLIRDAQEADGLSRHLTCSTLMYDMGVTLMPLSVRLDARTESLVNRLARRRRQTKSEVIRDAIDALSKQEEKAVQKKRPYDLLAHLIGCVDTGGANLSQNTGDKFSKLLREKASARRSR